MRLALVLSLLCMRGIAAADWGPAQFLVGQWKGDGSGEPGTGTGAFSFLEDLGGKVLVRKSFAEYPAANGKPAFRHDDLMILYREGGQLRADYFDSEEHVIHYSVKPVAGGAAFVSETAQAGPRYRLTYTSTGKDTLELKFEIAPPGKDFGTYLKASAHRDK